MTAAPQTRRGRESSRDYRRAWGTPFSPYR